MFPNFVKFEGNMPAISTSGASSGIGKAAALLFAERVGGYPHHAHAVEGRGTRCPPQSAPEAALELFIRRGWKAEKVSLAGKHITYMNVPCKISDDCDCAETRIHAPSMEDIGILACNDLPPSTRRPQLLFSPPMTAGTLLREPKPARLTPAFRHARKKMGNPQYEPITVD